MNAIPFDATSVHSIHVPEALQNYLRLPTEDPFSFLNEVVETNFNDTVQKYREIFKIDFNSIDVQESDITDFEKLLPDSKSESGIKKDRHDFNENPTVVAYDQTEADKTYKLVSNMGVSENPFPILQELLDLPPEVPRYPVSLPQFLELTDSKTIEHFHFYLVSQYGFLSIEQPSNHVPLTINEAVEKYFMMVFSKLGVLYSAIKQREKDQKNLSTRISFIYFQILIDVKLHERELNRIQVLLDEEAFGIFEHDQVKARSEERRAVDKLVYHYNRELTKLQEALNRASDLISHLKSQNKNNQDLGVDCNNFDEKLLRVNENSDLATTLVENTSNYNQNISDPLKDAFNHSEFIDENKLEVNESSVISTVGYHGYSSKNPNVSASDMANEISESARQNVDLGTTEYCSVHPKTTVYLLDIDTIRKGFDYASYVPQFFQLDPSFEKLRWLLSGSDNTTVPPSKESFRDGSVFSTLQYLEKELCRQIVRFTVRFNRSEYVKSDNKNKSIAQSRHTDLIIALSDELYTRKIELDRNRNSLRKRKSLLSLMRNSALDNFPILFCGFRLLNMIGKGGFAQVWEAFDPISLNLYAAKIHQLLPSMPSEKRIQVVQRVKQEIHIHRSLRMHPNIVFMKACFEISDDLLLTILELCEDGDLDSYIKKHGCVSERLVGGWGRQILEALQHMKNLSDGCVHHCDLKPGNILIHHGNVKLADFGLSQKVIDAPVLHRGGGTIWYQPPECLRMYDASSTAPEVYVSEKVDMWAIGCILFEMLMGRKPYVLQDCKIASKLNLADLLLKETAKELTFDSHIQLSDSCKDFVLRLLQFESESRPTIEEALRHQFITNLEH